MAAGASTTSRAGAPASDAEVQQEVLIMSKMNIFRPGMDVVRAVLLPLRSMRISPMTLLGTGRVATSREKFRSTMRVGNGVRKQDKQRWLGNQGKKGDHPRDEQVGVDVVAEDVEGIVVGDRRG